MTRMSKWIYLSHFLDSTTPAYSGGETFQSIGLKSIEHGDTCNTARWIMPNHIGTHIDFPRHFIEGGKSFSDYTPEFWILNAVHLIDVSPVAPSSRIAEDLLNIESIEANTDILIIKTGFGEQRDNECYRNAGPVFMPELADALRKQCPGIRLMGFDTISLSSWSDRELGRIAHRAFLCHSWPILLLEDMDLLQVGNNTKFHKVIISPLCVSNADASPCTVLAEIEE